jgi:hypothetical protein
MSAEPIATVESPASAPVAANTAEPIGDKGVAPEAPARRSGRKSEASKVIAAILEEEEEQVQKKRHKIRRDVAMFGGLFTCEYLSEDSVLVEDGEKDLKQLFVNVKFARDFGPIKAGDLFACVAMDMNAGTAELWNEADERVFCLDFGVQVTRVVPREEWKEEVLAEDEDDDASFEDDYESDEYDSEEDEELTEEEEEDLSDFEESGSETETENESETEEEEEEESETETESESESEEEVGKKRKKHSSSSHRPSKSSSSKHHHHHHKKQKTEDRRG